LERQQCYETSKLLQSSAIGKRLIDKRFWHILSDSILATDVTRIPEFIGKFSEIGDSFDVSNSVHRNLLAQMLISVSNISNCFRSFEYALKMGRAMEQEAELEIEYQKIHSSSGRTEFTSLPPLAQRESDFIENSVIPFVEAVKVHFSKLNLVERAIETQSKWQEFKDDDPSLTN
jgi:hypothetical protein